MSCVRDGDWEAWLDFFLEGVRVTAGGAVDTAHRLLALFHKDAERVRALGRTAANALRVFEALRARPVTTINDLATRTGVAYPTAARGVEAVAAASGLMPTDLTARARPGRGKRFAARQLAMRLCRDETGLTLREIGEWFGGIHYAAVSQNIRRNERDLKHDRTVRELNNNIWSRLDP